MKKLSLNQLRMFLFAAFTMFAVQMFAGAGFWDENATMVKLNVNGADKEYYVKRTGQGDITIDGVVSSLTFKSFENRTWKDGNGNICGDDFYFHYKMYAQGSSSSSWNDYKSNWKSASDNNQFWGNDVNKDLLAGLGNGTYVIEFYTHTTGNYNGTDGCGDNIDCNNDGPNYKIIFTKGGSTDCDVQAKGATIPAGTVIFYDNSNKLFSGEIWLSVPADDTNGNASNVNQGSYYRRNDKWYQMRNIDGDIWQATITTASSYGRMSFWNKDGHDADDVYENIVVFQAPYTSGKNLYKPDASKKCTNSDRKSDVYFKGSWSLRTGLFLNLSSTDRKIDDTNPITLKAEAIGVTGTNYTFEYRAFDADTWETLATQSSPEYILSGTKLPVKSTYYRVKYGTATSPEVKLAVLINCDEGGSAKNILKFDFGTLTELKGANSRTSSGDMAKAYTYQPWAKKINDGYYAVVATPYYCGCGEGSDMEQTVDQCEGNNMWFRDIKDHTLGDKGTAGKYGGMLMINFSDAKSPTAYEHILDASEKAAFVKGSTLSFSAYFASAAKPEAVEVKINMKLMIQYRAVGSEDWITKAELVNKVEYDDNWKYGNTSIDIDDPKGDYRVVIENYSAAGTGNDALIDDISLDLCVPTFPVSFYDEETDSEYDTYTYKQMDETQIIRIAKQDYGHGDNNCVVLLSVDESKKAGETGRYKVIDVMDNTSYKGADYYSTTKSVNELLSGNVGTGKLQALVTEPEICSDPTKFEDLKTKLYNGKIKPLDSADYMFSTNLLTYNIVCNTTITAAFDGNTSVCEELGKKEKDLPTLNVTFGSIASYVYYSISEDGNAVVSDVALNAAEIGAGKFSVDLNTLDQTKIIRTSGTRKFTVYMYEKASESSSKICEKTSAAIDLVIKPKPTYDTANWPAEVNFCQQKSITIKATNVTSYQWYVDKTKGEGAEKWDILTGATSATYNLPADAENGWRYKVELGNDYCTIVTTTPVTLIKIAGVAPTVKAYEECATKEPTKKYLKDLVTSSYTKLTWYKADKTTVIPEAEAYFDASELTSEAKVYYVTDTPDGGCESELSLPVTVMVKNSIRTVTLTPENEQIRLGAETNKTLTVEPNDAIRTKEEWSANGVPFDGVFPRKPYTDVEYKVTITDECGMTHTATAKTEVEWPTIFTPYNVDGANDDFVKDLDDKISIQVYDRTGDMVYEGSDGWAGEGKNGTLVMPGVYYYVATLPDGSKRKATVEVYK